MSDAALAILTGDTGIPVFLEVPIGLVHPHRLQLGNHLIALRHISLSLVEHLGLVQAVDFVSYLLGLYFSQGIYFYLEHLHPAYTTHRIFRQHSDYKGFKEVGNRAWEVKLFVVQNFDQIGY